MIVIIPEELLAKPNLPVILLEVKLLVGKLELVNPVVDKLVILNLVISKRFPAASCI